MKRFAKGMLSGLAVGLIVVGLLAIAAFLWFQKFEEKKSPDELESRVEGIISEIQIKVDGMTSPAKAEQVTAKVKQLPGVISCEPKLQQRLIVTQYYPDKITLLEIQQAIDTLGLKSSVPGSTGALKVIDYSIKFNQ